MSISRLIYCGLLSAMLILALPSFAATPAAQPSSVQGLELVTSIRPLALLARQLVAPEDTVKELVPTNQSPHHYQLTVADRVALEEADLVLWVGPELEVFLEKPLSQRQRPTLKIVNDPAIHWPEVVSHGDHGHDHHGHDHSSDRDPHVWLDPMNLQVVAKGLTQALVAQAPERTPLYEGRLAALIAELDATDKALAQSLQPVQGRPFVVFHPAYGHFIERYGLTQLDFIVFTPERSLGAKHRFQLSQLNASCVFGEAGYDPKRVEQIAKAAKAGVGNLDPLGAELDDNAPVAALLTALGEQFLSCLQEGSAS